METPPNPRSALCLRQVSLALLCTALVARADASLGGNEATIETDQLQAQAVRRVLPAAQYTVHELTGPSGAVVREYVAPTGMVFGVAWEGSSMPDLRQALGNFFDPYVAAAASGRRTRGAASVVLPGLVVQSTGHMRAFTGSAYIPDALPPGVTASEVR